MRTGPTDCSFSAEEEELGTVSIASVGKGSSLDVEMHWALGEGGSATAYLHNGHLTTEHEDDAHLKKNTEAVPDVVGIELLETLCTVASLQ